MIYIRSKAQARSVAMALMGEGTGEWRGVTLYEPEEAEGSVRLVADDGYRVTIGPRGGRRNEEGLPVSGEETE